MFYFGLGVAWIAWDTLDWEQSNATPSCSVFTNRAKQMQTRSQCGASASVLGSLLSWESLWFQFYYSWQSKIFLLELVAITITLDKNTLVKMTIF